MNRYFLTYTGKKIYPNKIKAKDICIKDVVHHLTKICRYGGQLSYSMHYSVAYHSILLAKYALITLHDKELAKHCLLHDAAEAYLGDIVNSVKDYLPDYKKLEKKLEKTICNKFNLKPLNDPIWKKIKEYDTRILLDEVKYLLPRYYELYAKQIPYKEPLNIDINIEFVSTSLTSNMLVRATFLRYCDLLGVTDD